MKTLLTICLACVLGSAKAQNLRCISASSYKVETPNGEAIMHSPASVCYAGNIFSFYTGATGTRTFEITERTNDNTRKIGRESFLNAESETNQKGDYSVEITYGINKKTIVISFTKFGQAYIIESTGFIGSPEKNKNTSVLAYRLKTGKAPMQKAAHSLIDVQQYFNEEFKYNATGTVTCDLKIRDDGHIDNAIIKKIAISSSLPIDSIRKKIEYAFTDMPNWVPAYDNERKPIQSEIEISINLNYK